MVSEAQPAVSAASATVYRFRDALAQMMLDSATEARADRDYDTALEYVLAVISVEPQPFAFVTLTDITLSLLSEVSPHTRARTLLERLRNAASAARLTDGKRLRAIVRAPDRAVLFNIARRLGTPDAEAYFLSREVISIIARIEDRASRALSAEGEWTRAEGLMKVAAVLVLLFVPLLLIDPQSAAAPQSVCKRDIGPGRGIVDPSSVLWVVARLKDLEEKRAKTQHAPHKTQHALLDEWTQQGEVVSCETLAEALKLWRLSPADARSNRIAASEMKKAFGP